jgi:hypothetical protein
MSVFQELVLKRDRKDERKSREGERKRGTLGHASERILFLSLMLSHKGEVWI